MADPREENWAESSAENPSPAGDFPPMEEGPAAEDAPAAENTAPAEEIPTAENTVPAEEIPAAENTAEAAGPAQAPRYAPDRDGWYRSAGEFGQSPETIYSDAHYEPAGSTTTPPRYYTPPVRPERVKREKPERKRRGIGLGGAIALCLICALLGGCLGAGINSWLNESRFDALEKALAENERVSAENAAAISTASLQQPTVASPVLSTGANLSPAQIYERACSQVVGITISYSTPSYFGGSREATVSGSGFILSEDGYIVTNYHVIQVAEESNLPIRVLLYDGTEYEASIVGREDVNDLAVLKIEATGLSPVTMGNSDELQVGDEVYAVGNPLGELEFSMSTGHVSALNRVISTEGADNISMFQLDAAVNPGNSGGPVYNTKGQVVGVVTAKYSDTDVEGLGFAIPSNDALRIAEDLVNNGYVTGKAYLGIWTDERYNAMVAQYYDMPLGAYVAEVSPGSAADQAGLESGDIITAVDGQQVESSTDLRNLIRQYSAGDSAELTYFRAGESRSVRIVFDERTPESGTTLPEREP